MVSMVQTSISHGISIQAKNIMVIVFKLAKSPASHSIMYVYQIILLYFVS